MSQYELKLVSLWPAESGEELVDAADYSHRSLQSVNIDVSGLTTTSEELTAEMPVP